MSAEVKELVDIAKEIKQHFIGNPLVTHNPQGIQRTQDGHIIYRIHPSMGQIFTKNGVYNIACNKIYVQNAGNTIVYLFGGFSFMPGDKLFLGAENDFAQTEGQLQIEFGDVSLDPLNINPINRFEIIKFSTNHPSLSFLPANGKITNPS